MSTRTTKNLVAATLFAGLLLPAGAPAFSLSGMFGSPVDAQLAAQVPQEKRQAINTADNAVLCVNQDVELAKLKEELADKQDDLASLGTKLAKSRASGAQTALDIAKMEAIMASNLGKLEDNAKILNDLKSDRVKNVEEQTGYQRKIDAATLYVRDWTQRVATKEKAVADFKANRCGIVAPATPAVSAAPAMPATSATPAAQNDDATVITHQEPGAASDKPAPAVPESNLTN
ncbi:MAG: hypothetical protein AUJ49_06620 [Desulfovibrionaceae bacterium CG1_02_65_16]|nr:MAG: hypothetical protein AUJ49_06620 [Desulfovibrionaceae bacterium CG1_02_65_16]